MVGTEEIREMLERWSKAEVQGDRQALHSLLGEDFRAVGPRGFVLTRAAWLERYTTGGLVTTTSALTEAQTRVYGDMAIVIARLTQHATYQGHDASGDFRATLVWQHHSEGWMLESLHLSPLAPSSSA